MSEVFIFNIQHFPESWLKGLGSENTRKLEGLE